jgi:hypothetical protein
VPHGAGYDVVHGKLSLKRIQPYSAAHAGHSGSSGLSAFGVNVLPHVAQVFWFGLFMTAASAVRVDTSAEALGVRPPGCWQAGFAAGCSSRAAEFATLGAAGRRSAASIARVRANGRYERATRFRIEHGVIPPLSTVSR